VSFPGHALQDHERSIDSASLSSSLSSLYETALMSALPSIPMRKPTGTIQTQSRVSWFRYPEFSVIGRVSMRAALTAKSSETGISAGFASGVIDTLSAFVGVLTLDGVLIETNRPPLNAANIVVEDVLGKPFAEEHWWSYSPLIQEQMRDAINRAGTGEPVRFDVDVQLSEGGFVPVDFRILPMRNDSGTITHLVASVIVITKRKQIENELRQSESRFRKLFDSDLVGIAFPDRFGGFSEGNDEFLRIVGYSREDLLDGLVRWDRMTPPEYRELDATHIAEAAERGSCSQYEKEYIRKDGRRIPVSIGYTLLEGSQDEYIAFIMDVSAQKQAEESLRESDRWFRALAESLPQLVWVANAEGERTFCNQRFIDYTGIPLTELTGTSWLRFVHPEDLARKIEKWKQCVQTGEPYVNEYRLRRHDGVYRHFLSRANPVNDQNGQIERWLGTSTDIHDRKLAEETLRLSEKLAAAAPLAASMAHEINNPLTSVTNLIYLAIQDQDLSETVRGYLSMADEELARVAQIARQTLRFHKQSISPTLADPCALMDSVLCLFARRFDGSSIVLERDYRTAEKLYCFCDDLRQVFASLISNSLEATGHGGRIRIRISPGQCWKVNGERGIRVTVADNGSGISRDLKRRVFEPFVSTKKFTGTGLGLWVTEGIVRKHGGRIAFRSTAMQDHHGTVFSLFFPFSGVSPTHHAK
jgi:PAS domain S-box-containing protein